MDPAAAIFPPTILEKLFHVVFQRLISTAIIQYCQANPLGIGVQYSSSTPHATMQPKVFSRVLYKAPIWKKKSSPHAISASKSACPDSYRDGATFSFKRKSSTRFIKKKSK